MIERLLAPLFQPRFGMVFLTAVASILMMFHWLPMGIPGAVVVALAFFRPQAATRPLTWWLVSVSWLAAVILLRHHFEDHVYLLTAWIVALAVALRHEDDDRFVAAAAWQARVLLGVAFTAAVAWKVYFTEFLTGTSMWVFLLVDGRFAPLATAVGYAESDLEQDRAGLDALLAGEIVELSSHAPAAVLRRLTAVALLALLLEALVAVSHLSGDRSPLTRLRLPSLMLFATVTYAVVPVLLFALPLAVLVMAVQGWRREVFWVFPVLVLVSAIRLATLMF